MVEPPAEKQEVFLCIIPWIRYTNYTNTGKPDGRMTSNFG